MAQEIDKGDWRLHTTAHLAEDWKSPWSGQISPKGTRITQVANIALNKKKILTIPIPNATAFMLNASARSYESAKALRADSQIDKSLKPQVGFKSETDAIDYIERMAEAIVLAFSAIEAFANETIPTDFVYAKHKHSAVILEASNKETIERHISTDEKLISVLPQVLSCSSPKGTHCWQSYKLLKSTRDRIIHMKTEDRIASGTEVDTVWKAIIVAPAPHLTAKSVMDHFVKAMSNKPKWHERFLHAT